MKKKMINIGTVLGFLTVLTVNALLATQSTVPTELTNKHGARIEVIPVPKMSDVVASVIEADVDTVANSEPDIPEEDIDLLARLITAEQGYGREEIDYYLTGSVVINRMNHYQYPDTLKGVIYQSGQYQCVTNGHINRPYDDLAWEVAEGLLAYGTTIDERVVFQAEFPQGSGIYTQRGRTLYCYKK